MAATTVKNDPIKNDKMSFRTQMVNGKPQIFFDAIDGSSNNTKSKRTGRTMSNASRLIEQQKNRVGDPKPPVTNKQTTKSEQPSSKIRGNEDASTLGVYMTIDELAELVKAVKDNAKNESKTTSEVNVEPSPPQRPSETITAPVVPKLDLPAEPAPARISPREQNLNNMADKKRQKWMREKAEMEKMQMEIEYDQLKHQLSPSHSKSSFSPERSTIQYDFPPSQPTHKPPPAAPAYKPPPTAPPLPPPSKQNEFHHDVPSRANEDSNTDAFKNLLMEKKQQQWKQENSEKMPLWNPFGRPGAGAPNSTENHARTSQPPSNPAVSYRPSVLPLQSDNPSSSYPPPFLHSDQTRVPAAMRTNLLFGDVRFDEDVKTAKEIERRQWLDDLQKQIEDNKRHRYTQQETDRRKDFLNESVRPLVQEAANRHQQQNGTSNTTNLGQNSNQFQQHGAQTYDRSHEGNDPAQYDKRAQLLDKLKRNGYQTDSLVKPHSNGQSTNQRTGEKLFGPDYETTTTRQNMNSRIEPLHLNVAPDQQHSYRPSYARRDEAVNTVDATFRSDHSGQNDMRMPPHRQVASHTYEDSDLPPQIPNHHYQNSGYRNIPNQPGKNNVRMRPTDDSHPSRRTSTTTYHSNQNDDRTVSQISHPRTSHIPLDANQRPLWNYGNREHREYVPNSKRDPHYEKRQRLKHFEQGNFDRIDDVQKKTCYNRWNSDSELQQRKAIPTNRIRSTMSKGQSYGNHKDESIMNLLKTQHKQQQEAFGPRKSALNRTRNDEEINSNRDSSLDKYENYTPYARGDEIVDHGQGNSPISRSREATPNKQTEATTNDNYHQREWEDTNRSYPLAQQQPPPPQSRQEHILQQLSAIKENLVRRQRELATSTNAIPV